MPNLPANSGSIDRKIKEIVAGTVDSMPLRQPIQDPTALDINSQNTKEPRLPSGQLLVKLHAPSAPPSICT